MDSKEKIANQIIQKHHKSQALVELLIKICEENEKDLNEIKKFYDKY